MFPNSTSYSLKLIQTLTSNIVDLPSPVFVHCNKDISCTLIVSTVLPHHPQDLRRHVVHCSAVHGGGEGRLVRGLDLGVGLEHISKSLQLSKRDRPTVNGSQ